MTQYETFLKEYGSDRKAAKALGISRTQFNNKYRKLAGLCVISSCKNPPKPDCTRCEPCLQKAKSKKSKEELSEKNRIYRLENRERLSKYNSDYQKRNLDRFHKARKKYDSTEAGKLSSHRRRAKRRNCDDAPMSSFELEYLQAKTPHCIICGPGKKTSLDHFIPLSKGGKLTLDNTLILCSECNSKKRDLDPEEFFTIGKYHEIINLFESHNEYQKVGSVKEYKVSKELDHSKCRNFINRYHYSGTSPGVIHAFTLSFKGRVLGVCLFSKPSRQNITIPNASYLLELSRLFIVDGTPKNAESYFIAKCLHWLKSNTRFDAVVSFADPTEGHEGIIYKASNFKFLGQTLPNYHYETSDGSRVHKRQVWDRAKQNQRKEAEQANDEGLKLIPELPKNKFAFYLKLG